MSWQKYESAFGDKGLRRDYLANGKIYQNWFKAALNSHGIINGTNGLTCVDLSE